MCSQERGRGGSARERENVPTRADIAHKNIPLEISLGKFGLHCGSEDRESGRLEFDMLE